MPKTIFINTIDACELCGGPLNATSLDRMHHILAVGQGRGLFQAFPDSTDEDSVLVSRVRFNCPTHIPVALDLAKRAWDDLGKAGQDQLVTRMAQAPDPDAVLREVLVIRDAVAFSGL